MTDEQFRQIFRYLVAAVILVAAATVFNLCSCVTEPNSYVPKPIIVHYNTTTARTSLEFR